MHPHRTWLHLVPADPNHVPTPQQVQQAAQVLIGAGLAACAGPLAELVPGPQFARLLRPGSLPQLARSPGEVRVDAGVRRCYPDPGPDGFDTEPPNTYRAACPTCQAELQFFHLSFPLTDPLEAVCASCRRPVDVSRLGWTPELPVASAEITFADVDGRPSLRHTPVFSKLEAALGAPLRELFVTL